MSKYINANELIEKLEKEYRSKHYSDYIDGRNAMIDATKILIAEMSPAEVVEVVRCKDCKYWEYKCQGDFDFIYGDCLFWQIEFCSDYYMETTGNHYCGFAKERKESKVKKCFDIPKEVAEKLLKDTERKEANG